MFKNKLKIVAAALAVVSVSGCAVPPAPVVAGPDVAVLEKLASYAQQSSVSMQRLASIQIDRSGVAPVELRAPAGLEKPISITWSGPIDKLVKKVAEMTGYAYEGEIGSKPANQVHVSISVTNLSAFQVLADAGAQAGVAADIVIRPDQKRMAISYPPTTPNGGYVAAH